MGQEGSGSSGAHGGKAPRVTVICVPRDHFSDTERSLEALIERTDVPFELVYVLGRAPRDVVEYLRRRQAEVGFTLIERDEHLVPNHARNLGLRRATTEYVAFLDNDAIVGPDWLGPLVRCADDTGACLVSPLQLIGPLENEAIHFAGGWIELDETTSPRPLHTELRYQRLYVSEVPEPMTRVACDFAEFHCMLARRTTLEEMGGLDEALLSTREVLDLGLEVSAHGGSVWFEPESRVTYLPPKRLRWSEVGFMARRWGERANRQSYEHFYAKHDLDTSSAANIGSANARRRTIYEPIRSAVAKLRVRPIERGVAFVLYRLDRLVNHLFIRPGRTSY